EADPPGAGPLVGVEAGHEDVPGDREEGAAPPGVGQHLLGKRVGQGAQQESPFGNGRGGHGSSSSSASATRSPITSPASSSSHAHCAPGPHSRKCHCPSSVTQKSKTPSRSSSRRR